MILIRDTTDRDGFTLSVPAQTWAKFTAMVKLARHRTEVAGTVIDPEAFEIAFTAAARASDESEDEAPVPLCAACGAPVGIFPEVILNWRHFRGAATASGTHETYDPGHASEVAWYLEGEAAEEF
jgi:hypothetical protein